MSVASSISPPQRILQLDVLRGFALLGIYWINIVVFALPYGAYALPTLLGDATQANTVVWAISELLVEGSMRGLFSMLFGASAMLLLSKVDRDGGEVAAVDRYYRRNLYLILFGLLHAYLLLWPYDVLFDYGLIGLMLFPLRNLRPTVLIAVGCLLLLAGDFELSRYLSPTSSHKVGSISRFEMAEPARDNTDDEDNRGASDWRRESFTIHMEDDLELYRSNYPAIFLSQVNDVVEQQSTSLYSEHLFDIGGMMLIGMALFKLGVMSGRRSLRFYLLLAAGGYLLTLTSRGYAVYDQLANDFYLSDQLDFRGGVDYDFGRLPLSLAHVGLIGVLCKARILAPLQRALAAVGKLALTNYIGQTALSIMLFYGFGLGLYGTFERYQLVWLCLGMWSLQVGGSLLWLRYFRIGPLEWVWRSLTLQKWQPLRAEHVRPETESTE